MILLLRGLLVLCVVATGETASSVEFGKTADLAFERGEYEAAAGYYWLALENAGEGGPLQQSVDPNISLLVQSYFQSGFISAKTKEFLHRLKKAEDKFGAEAPGLSLLLNVLALMFNAQGKYDEALSYLERSLIIHQKHSDAGSPHLSYILNTIAFLYNATDREAQGEKLFLLSVKLRQKRLKEDPLQEALASANHAFRLSRSRNSIRAQKTYQQTIELFNQGGFAKHSNLGTVLNQYAALLEKHGQKPKAAQLRTEAKSIWQNCCKLK